MISGSTRYARSLGFVGGLGAGRDRTPHPVEKALGVNFSGQWSAFGGDGSGVMAAATPTSLLLMVLGAGLGAALSKGAFLKGSLLGGALGLLTATGVRGAEAIGV